MQITLKADEARLLRELLTNHLAELRSEITRTERYALRQDLKHDEQLIKGLLERLEAPTSVGA